MKTINLSIDFHQTTTRSSFRIFSYFSFLLSLPLNYLKSSLVPVEHRRPQQCRQGKLLPSSSRIKRQNKTDRFSVKDRPNRRRRRRHPPTTAGADLIKQEQKLKPPPRHPFWRTFFFFKVCKTKAYCPPENILEITKIQLYPFY